MHVGFALEKLPIQPNNKPTQVRRGKESSNATQKRRRKSESGGNQGARLERALCVQPLDSRPDCTLSLLGSCVNPGARPPHRRPGIIGLDWARVWVSDLEAFQILTKLIKELFFFKILFIYF